MFSLSSKHEATLEKFVKQSFAKGVFSPKLKADVEFFKSKAVLKVIGAFRIYLVVIFAYFYPTKLSVELSV